MGYKYTLVFSREITDEESAVLREASPGCADAVFGPDTHPTNADVPVTRMDVDDTVSATLAEAIQAGLDTVKNVPDLSIPGLTVPAQPAGPVDSAEPQVAVEETPEAVAEDKPEAAAGDEPAAKKSVADEAVAGAGSA
jgi:hypothetical protein